ncbi:MAG TPA: hypothetical protein VI980_08240 [Acidimicrobiia bacterium]|nr:hypothetical protein [Acidimicrobiia bacterium]
MQAKNVLYATVGAPVVAARKVGEGVTTLRTKISEGTSGYGQAAEKAIDSWAVEGEKVVARFTDGKVVEDISAKVDLDQAKEQVSKLRDQLEDMLATWRSSFRPEKADVNGVKEAKAPAAKATSPKKPSSKTGTKASAAKTTESTATKTSSEKTEPVKADQAS